MNIAHERRTALTKHRPGRRPLHSEVLERREMLAADAALDAAETATLLHMREEEKLARDVYLALAEQWEAPIFENIAASESRHMASVGKLIDKYGLQDPVGENGPGEFRDAVFATLYSDLVAAGTESIGAAYKVGALIEEMDIVDLRDALQESDNADVDGVYQHLLRGSGMHLRAFASRIAAEGDSYEAQYLTQAEFDAMAESARLTGIQGIGRRDPQGRVPFAGTLKRAQREAIVTLRADQQRQRVRDPVVDTRIDVAREESARRRRDQRLESRPTEQNVTGDSPVRNQLTNRLDAGRRNLQN